MALNIIQAGFGGWGINWHETVLMPFKGVKTTAWVDADPKVLKKVAKLEGVDPANCFPSLKEAVKTVKAEAVVITAGIGGHVPLSREALNAGLHVLVEKPFAPKISQAKQLVELAKTRKRILMVSQNYRHQPAVRTVEKVLSTGDLGPVYSVSIDFRRNAGIGRKKSEHHCIIDHPLWMDMAIHHLEYPGRKFWGVIHKDNEASINWVKKVGFKYAGMLENRYFLRIRFMKRLFLISDGQIKDDLAHSNED